MFMLDTNVLIALENRNLNVLRRLASLREDEVAISSIVEFEFRTGLEGKSGDSLEYRSALAILDTLRVYPFDSAAAQHAAALKARDKKGFTFDSLIAAHALSLGKVLVTSNTKDFEKISGLKLDNWA
jgi:tRNA(fMet)-specific endonuclease VapC